MCLSLIYNLSSWRAKSKCIHLLTRIFCFFLDTKTETKSAGNNLHDVVLGNISDNVQEWFAIITYVVFVQDKAFTNQNMMLLRRVFNTIHTF